MTTTLDEIENTETELSSDELVAECKARANIYRLLSGAFLEEPTLDYLNAIRSPTVMASLKEMGVNFGEDFTATPIEKLQDELACEFAVLFVVAGGCPAVESVRLLGRYQQQPCFEIRDIYRKAGFKVSAARFAVFEDQLGVQLAFLAEMLDRAALALATGDEHGYMLITKEIKRFWALHPGKWVRGYATLLARATDYSFYREMAKLLGSFAQWELDLLGVKVDDLDGGKLKVPKAEIEYEYDPKEPVCNTCEKTDGEDDEEALKKIDISLIQARLEGRK
jgi:TorA maturation chaperone TorD